MSRKKQDKTKKPTILLIEDDSFLAQMYQTKLTLENYQVLVAGDGEKGLEMIRKHKPDLILLDIILPKLNGFDLMKQIRRNKILAPIPVILLTNLSQKEDVEKGLALGARDYLIKAHYMPSEVVAKIKKILSENKK